jgi:anti-sigma B factor antagonist
MTTSQGIVRFHQEEQTVTFRVEGRGTMNQSMPLRRCVEGFLDRGVRRVRVDLRDCTYMDSTFLGTLLTLKKTAANRSTLGGKVELALNAPSTACARILHQMGLDGFLPTQEAELEQTGEWTQLVCEPDDAHSFRRNIAQAHEELASLPGPAGEQFKAVVRCMNQADKDKPTSRPATSPPAD